MSLASQQNIDLGSWVVTKDFVDAYLRATEDECLIYRETGTVPPVALAAQVLEILLRQLSLPAGSVHTSQDINTQKALVIGQTTSGYAKTSRPIRRGDWEFISTSFILRDDAGQTLLEGKTTVMAPVGNRE